MTVAGVGPSASHGTFPHPQNSAEAFLCSFASGFGVAGVTVGSPGPQGAARL